MKLIITLLGTKFYILIFAGLRCSSNTSRWVWIVSLLFGLLLGMSGFLEGTPHPLKPQMCTGTARISYIFLAYSHGDLFSFLFNLHFFLEFFSLTGYA